MSHLATLALSVAALACLACATDRPQRDLFRRELGAQPTRLLRLFGWVLLASALSVSLANDAWALGLIAWVGHTSAGAALVYLGLLGWNNRRKRPW